MNKLENLGIRTDIDLALHLPIRYEDETKLMRISDALFQVGKTVQVEGVVTIAEIQTFPRKQFIVFLDDDTDSLVLRFIHFYPGQVKQFSVGKRFRVMGELRDGFIGPEMVHPSYRKVGADEPLPTTLTPVYSSCAGISQSYLRKAISACLERLDLSDTLPAALLAAMGLPTFSEALMFLHNPPAGTDEQQLVNREHPAWKRMKFDELLAQQLSMRRAQQSRRRLLAYSFPVMGKLAERFIDQLPFPLTSAQRVVCEEIRQDLAGVFPMQRLLQGDVGSGKTVVAAIAALQVIGNGYQVVMMAPTEILAEQHAYRLSAWMAQLGVSVGLIIGNMKKKQKQAMLSDIEKGRVQFIIGTHALIQETVQFAKLGLVIVDEQHRFGVGQRLLLRNKANLGQAMPHQLMMSATPIPRTLAMTFYADLDVSVIRTLPPGRKPVITRLISQERRDEVIRRIHAAAKQGRQVYWVCPLIEESEALELQTAVDTHALLVMKLTGLSVGLLHGRMKADEKQQVMTAFQEGRIRVLVSTTVIEVGVDVPNASLMVIDHAERFGLSQLHQLRGRVGRGDAESVCLLMYQKPLSEVAKRRLMIMRETNDGFRIAQEDLAIRGPGEFLGARQSGQVMLRFADLEKDGDLIGEAVALARRLLAGKMPDADKIISAHLQRWLNDREAFLNV